MLEATPSLIAEIYQHIVARCLNMVEQKMVFDFIQQGNLDQFISEGIEKLESIVHNVKKSDQLKANQIKTIAYSFLKRFNEELVKIQQAEEKELLKKLLAKIAKGIVIEIQQEAPTHAFQIKRSIEQGFEQAVLLEGYNQKDFENYFQLGYTDVSKVGVSVTNVKVMERLIWDDKKANLEKLALLLKNDYSCIKSKNEFLSFFNGPDQKVIHFDRKRFDLLIFLIHKLYDKSIIRLKGGKGLWRLVSVRFADFNNKPMDFNPAKRLHSLKGKKVLKSALEKDVEEILEYIQVK